MRECTLEVNFEGLIIHSMFLYNYFDPDLKVVIFCEKEGPPEHKVKLINKIEEYEIDYEIEE